MKHHLFHLHALSALHAGVGQAVGAVDLPIARERANHLPYFPGSSLKGVLRESWGDEDDRKALFGPERIQENSEAFAGALAVGDARLLLLPVRSMAGVMAWATCPFVLKRYRADLALAGVAPPVEVPEVAAGRVLLTTPTLLTVDRELAVFDDLDLHAEAHAHADAWAEHLRLCLFGAGDAEAARHFDRRFAMLADDDFAFLAETGTEVRARIRIDQGSGTVEDGALWYEENLPAESVLWGVVGIGPERTTSKAQKSVPLRNAAQLSEAFAQALSDGAVLQLGGKASIGRGLARLMLSGG